MTMSRRAGLLALALLLVFAAGVVAQDGRIAGSRGQAAVASDAVQLQAARASRQSTIAELLSRWSSPEGQYQFERALHAADDATLSRLSGAESVAQIESILASGRPGVIENSFGSTASDYAFTPVTPCRIFDTRNTADGPILAGGTREFYVYGTTAIADQGGNAAGCAAPNGEPRAVHLNLTVVPVGAQGHVRVYPANVATPDTSVINFKAGTNTANALTVKTYYATLCIPPCSLKEIEVFALADAHVIADVMGYYYPGDLTAPTGKTQVGNWNAGTFGTAAGADMWGAITFPQRLASAPAAPDANFIAPGGASTTNCPGSVANPQAATGQLCLYARTCTRATFQCIFAGSTGSCTTADAHGAGLWLTSSAAGDAFCYGTWAVTAP
jgi:hypothetical protein